MVKDLVESILFVLGWFVVLICICSVAEAILEPSVLMKNGLLLFSGVIVCLWCGKKLQEDIKMRNIHPKDE